jgi:uncharacterized protein (TIGR03067 family)
MRKRTLLVALAGLAVVVAAGAVVLGCDSRTEPEKLQGQWQVNEMQGWFEFYLPTVAAGPSVLSFTGDDFVFQNSPDPNYPRVTGTFACDTSASPKRITFIFDGRTVVGIYSIFGGSLRLSVGTDDKVPPSRLEPGRRLSERPALLFLERDSRQDRGALECLLWQAKRQWRRWFP